MVFFVVACGVAEGFPLLVDGFDFGFGGLVGGVDGWVAELGEVGLEAEGVESEEGLGGGLGDLVDV